jgi:hypothetical protein
MGWPFISICSRIFSPSAPAGILIREPGTRPSSSDKLYQAVVGFRDHDWVKTVQFMVKGGKPHILGPD